MLSRVEHEKFHNLWGLVGNPKARFSLDAAHIIQEGCSVRRMSASNAGFPELAFSFTAVEIRCIFDDN